MTERRLKKKTKQEKNVEVKLDLGDTFDVANAKDKDFDLDLDAAKFQGKKGQAGTRTKAVA
jgi:ankyrin repeat protein